MRFFKNFLVFL